MLLSLFAKFLLLRGAQALHPTPAAWSGVDLSQLATEDANGTDFPFRASASSNSTIDALTLLKQRGANAFRMRVWNDPCADGRCNASEYSYANVQGLLTMATRTQAAGLRFIVDFHYSDWWADPGKQRKPTAWVGLSIDALVDAVENFTATTVRQLVAQGTPPHAVQIGNEITNGMLWSNASLGESCADGGKLYCKNSSGVRWPLADTWETLGRLVAAGIRAVRREAPTSLVAIHTDLGNHIKVDGAKYVSDWYQNLSNAVARAETARQLLRWKKSTTHDGDAVVNTSTTASLDYDLIGLSTYPTWDKGTTIDSIVEMGKLAVRFPGKKVYIAETSYPAVPDSKGAPPPEKDYPATEAGQLAFLFDVRTAMAKTLGDQNGGVLWWEGSERCWGCLFGSGYKPDNTPSYVARPALLQGFQSGGSASAARARVRTSPRMIPFSSFIPSCESQRTAPLVRFWGSRPRPDLSMIIPYQSMWASDDKNLAVLPRWKPATKGANFTIPFVDTHIAVRFLGGVSNFSVATAKDCADDLVSKVWCDLVVRDEKTGALHSRFDLVNSRLDLYVANGIDVMIVMGDVPWAFVNVTSEGCQNFGCQYLPPDDPKEFGTWIGALAQHVLESYGVEYASRVQWRLGTEGNGPRWGDHGKYYNQYLESYIAAVKAIKKVTPKARVGASNWVEVIRPGASGNFSHGGSDGFQFDFYGAIANDSSIPLDWISISHYGGGSAGTDTGANFPGADYIERTPYESRGLIEIDAMRARAKRPDATLEIQEWGILNNEKGQPTQEPSSLGAAWTAASATRWICEADVNKIFHWKEGVSIRNSSHYGGDNRIVQFYEAWAWDMALLELFIGGVPRYATFDLMMPSKTSSVKRKDVQATPSSGKVKLNGTIAIIESAVGDDELYVLVSALGVKRESPFRTTIMWNTSGALHSCVGGAVAMQQYVMNASTSVIETVVRELTGTPGMLIHDDGLAYSFSKLLTPAGIAYVQQPENLERYWDMQAKGLQPTAYEGALKWSSKDLELTFDVTAPSVTVVVAKCK